MAAALLIVFSPVPALAGQARLQGTVALGNGTPVAGARVYAVHAGDDSVSASTTTSADGHFVLEALPAGTHQLAVELDGGLYTVANAIELSAGESRNLNLLVATERPAATSPQHAQAGVAGIWSSPLAASLVVVGAAVGVGAILDSATSNGDDEVSPF